MKKVALILLVCIYTLSTLGIGLKKFYCCDKLASISVSFEEEGKGKINKDGCCNTQYNSLKVEDKHLASEKISIPAKYSIDVNAAFDLSNTKLLPQQLEIINGSHAPPLHENVPIYIYNCVFRV